MSDLNIPEVGGHGAPQAFTQVNPASSFGNDVAKPMAAPQIDPGAFQNVAGDAAMAKAIGDVSNTIADTVNREKALRVAGETEQRKLQTAEYDTAQIETKQVVKDAQMRGYLDPDSMNNLYQDTLKNKLDGIDKKYTYQTAVGNSLPKLRQLFVDGSQASYNGKEVENARVDGIKTSTIQAVQTTQDYIQKSITDGSFTPELWKQKRDAIIELTSSPSWVVANGGSAAAYVAQQKMLKDADTDVVGSLINNDPKMTEQLLESTGPNDPVAFLDPSTRTILHQTAHRETLAVAAEQKAALNEASNNQQLTNWAGIKAGTIGTTEIMKQQAAGKLTAGDAVQQLNMVWGIQQKREADAQHAADKAERARLTNAILHKDDNVRTDAGVGYSYHSAKEQKAADLVWETQVAPHIANMPQVAKDAAIAAYAAKSNIIPSSIKTKLRRDLNSTDENTVRGAVTSIQKLVPKSPWILNTLKGDQKTTYELMANQGKSLAYTQGVIAKQYTRTDTEKSLITGISNKYIHDNPNAANKGVGVTLPISGQAVWQDSFNHNMLLTGGDTAASANLASNDVKALGYGVSQTGTAPAAVVRNAPEALNNTTSENINSAAVNYMKSQGIPIPKDWHLAGAGTGTNKTPLYVVVDKNGSRVKGKDGNPLSVWNYGPTETDAYKKQVKEQAKLLDAAKVEQEIEDLRTLNNKSAYKPLTADEQVTRDKLAAKHPGSILALTANDFTNAGKAGINAVEGGLNKIGKAAKDWKKNQSGFPEQNAVNTVTPGTFKEQK